jgi:hypothetical protein
MQPNTIDSTTGSSMGKKMPLCCLRRESLCQASGSHVGCVELVEDVASQHRRKFQPVPTGDGGIVRDLELIRNALVKHPEAVTI